MFLGWAMSSLKNVMPTLGDQSLLLMPCRTGRLFRRLILSFFVESIPTTVQHWWQVKTASSFRMNLVSVILVMSSLWRTSVRTCTVVLSHGTLDGMYDTFYNSAEFVLHFLLSSFHVVSLKEAYNTMFYYVPRCRWSQRFRFSGMNFFVYLFARNGCSCCWPTFAVDLQCLPGCFKQEQLWQCCCQHPTDTLRSTIFSARWGRIKQNWLDLHG